MLDAMQLAPTLRACVLSMSVVLCCAGAVLAWLCCGFVFGCVHLLISRRAHKSRHTNAPQRERAHRIVHTVPAIYTYLYWYRSMMWRSSSTSSSDMCVLFACLPLRACVFVHVRVYVCVWACAFVWWRQSSIIINSSTTACKTRASCESWRVSLNGWCVFVCCSPIVCIYARFVRLVYNI